MGLRHLVLIAFLDDTIDKASEIDTNASVDGVGSALPSSWAQLAWAPQSVRESWGGGLGFGWI